ncbi:hypothetical protein PENSPDRAFT_659034 [Peniophora sp. CONT]|nr:hypothetical protein PENSPDRAFT_659034 [Peniophora sp. CONT]
MRTKKVRLCCVFARLVRGSLRMQASAAQASVTQASVAQASVVQASVVQASVTHTRSVQDTPAAAREESSGNSRSLRQTPSGNIREQLAPDSGSSRVKYTEPERRVHFSESSSSHPVPSWRMIVPPPAIQLSHPQRTGGQAQGPPSGRASVRPSATTSRPSATPSRSSATPSRSSATPFRSTRSSDELSDDEVATSPPHKLKKYNEAMYCFRTEGDPITNPPNVTAAAEYDVYLHRSENGDHVWYALADGTWVPARIGMIHPKYSEYMLYLSNDNWARWLLKKTVSTYNGRKGNETQCKPRAKSAGP